MLAHKRSMFDFFSLNVSTGVATVVNFYLLSWLAFNEGATAVAAFGLFFSGGLTLTNICTFRTQETLAKFLYNGSQYIHKSLLKYTVFLDGLSLVIFTSICFALIHTFEPTLQQKFGSFYQPQLWIIYWGFYIVKSTGFGLIIAQEQHVKSAATSVLASLVRLITFLALPTLAGFDYFTSLTIAYILSEIIFFTVFSLQGVITLYKAPAASKPSFEWSEVHSHSVKIFASSLIKSGHQNLSEVLFSFFAANQIAASYIFLRKIFNLTSMISNSLAQVFYGKLSRSTPNLRKIYENSLKINGLLIVVGLGILVCVFGVKYYGPVIEALNSKEFSMIALYTFIAVISRSTTWWIRPVSNKFNPLLSIWVDGIWCCIYMILVFLIANQFISTTGFIQIDAITSALIALFSFVWLGKKTTPKHKND